MPRLRTSVVLLALVLAGNAPYLAAETGSLRLSIESVSPSASDAAVAFRFTLATEAEPGPAEVIVTIRFHGNDSFALEPPDEWGGGTIRLDVTASPAVRDGAFEASWGPGRYELVLAATGPAGASAVANASLDVEAAEPMEEHPVVVEVADTPPALRFAADSVNDDGKRKSPGQALITRVVATDPDGIRDVTGVTFETWRTTDLSGSPSPPLLVERRTVPVAADPNGTTAALEDRFVTAPMKDGRYLIRATAEGRVRSVPIERTFEVLDVAPTANVTFTTDAAPPSSRITGVLRVEDKNFGSGALDPGPVRELGRFALVLYRGSAEVREPGWSLAFEGGRPWEFPEAAVDLADAAPDAPGLASRTFGIAVPAEAREGTYRLSVYEVPAAAPRRYLGAAAFEVARDAPPAAVGAPVADSAATPDGPSALRVDHAVVARGEPWLSPRRAHVLALDAPPAPDARWTSQLLDWTGRAVDERVLGPTPELAVPQGLAPGRYLWRVTPEGGAPHERPFHVGARLAIESRTAPPAEVRAPAGAPVVFEVRLMNAGNVAPTAVEARLVDLPPLAGTATLSAPDGSWSFVAGVDGSGVVRFAPVGDSWAPGTEAVLHVGATIAPGTPAGRFSGKVRVFVEGADAP
ncbi:MAG: hypothetical protein ACT4PT_06975 [Methanobacteriota archaeon]